MTYESPMLPYCGPAKFYGSKVNKPIKRLVIHLTISPCEIGGARSVAAYFRSYVTRPSSAHVVIDPSEAVQVVWDSYIAFHAPPNEHSKGYELCDPGTGPASRWDDLNHRRMLRQAARLVAADCLAFGIPPVKLGPYKLREGRKGICGHADVSKAFGQTDHTDPDSGAFPWRRFMRMVRAEYERLQA